MGARILCVADGLASVLYSSVELARRLAAAGHRLTFAGPPDTRKLVEHHGLGFLPLAESRYHDFLEADARTGVIQRLLDLRSRRERAKEALAAGAFARAALDLDPDLLLINGEMHEHIIAASATGLPTALMNTFVSIWKRPGLPPPHCLVRPGVGWQGSRAGISLLWFALRLRKWRRGLWRRSKRIGCDRLSVLRDLARESGFDLRGETDAGQWLIPFTYRRLPVLSLHALEFEFPHRPPAGVHHVGPMVLESRIDRPMTEEDRLRLDGILEGRRRSAGDRRLIYAGFGSVFSADRAFLHRLLEITAERPHWDLVLSLSDRIDPAELGRLPDGTHVFSWLPQTEVLRHADAAVTHGGINTIDECVLSGVPVLVYCGFETDMGGTTARVVHHGIGLAGDRRRDGTGTICEHIDRLLHETHFAHTVERMRRIYAAYAEERVAERTVEALLGGEASTGPSDRSSARGAGR